MKKTFEGFYGYTYYYKNGVLSASPTLKDGGYDEEVELAVEDFVEPLTDEEMAIVIRNLE